ncbi:hypothetical protein EVAR_22532_1 [Eumeta japonica]|uniref:Uncharacterized protein n=1 Tax=Eumeta variegata TaxID=151549 RepID=A0A4C1U8N3_EUMVA|nr:hypothetical protein EVAR_22532_1 [Eumeta japonica]
METVRQDFVDFSREAPRFLLKPSGNYQRLLKRINNADARTRRRTSCPCGSTSYRNDKTIVRIGRKPLGNISGGRRRRL